MSLANAEHLTGRAVGGLKPEGAVVSRGRILVVDDDRAIREILDRALTEEGYTVNVADSSREALGAMRRERPDIVTTDLMRPGETGFDFIRAVREQSNVPVIVLTAADDLMNSIAAFELGADGYITKPFEFRVLLRHIRGLLRAQEAHPARTVRIGALEVRSREGVARLYGRSLSLTRTEFRLLATMALRPGHVFTRDELLYTVWGYDFFGDGRLVDVAIRRLRRKLERDPLDPRIIRTVRGHGYTLAPTGL